MIPTKKMEDFFNLPPITTNEETNDENLPSKTKEELFKEAEQIYSSLSTTEKVDHALPAVMGLEVHDNEMDEIAKKAIKTFDDLVSLGGNVPDMHAGKIFEVAGQMLKTALDAKNAKADKKLRMIELQIKKIKTEQTDPESGQNGKSSAGEFDRNELLGLIISAKSKETDK